MNALQILAPQSTLVTLAGSTGRRQVQIALIWDTALPFSLGIAISGPLLQGCLQLCCLAAVHHALWVVLQTVQYSREELMWCKPSLCSNFCWLPFKHATIQALLLPLREDFLYPVSFWHIQSWLFDQTSCQKPSLSVTSSYCSNRLEAGHVQGTWKLKCWLYFSNTLCWKLCWLNCQWYIVLICGWLLHQFSFGNWNGIWMWIWY